MRMSPPAAGASVPVLPPSTRAALYRAVCASCKELPSATTLYNMLVASGAEGVSRAAVEAALLDLNAMTTHRIPRHTEHLVAACVRKLRAAGDGGHADLDKTADLRASFVPLQGLQGHLHGAPEWVLPPENLQWASAEARSDYQSRESRCRVLFLHGGGYAWYSPSDVYRPLTSRLALATEMPLLAVDYRLCPANPFPAALHDALVALAWLWEHGPPVGGSGVAGGVAGGTWRRCAADAVYVVGDSAGGGLALCMISALALGELAPGVPLPVVPRPPTALALISPWTDLSASLPSYSTRAWVEKSLHGDCIFSNGGDLASEIEGTVRCSMKYAPRELLQDPRVSPVFLPLPLLRVWLPPTLLVVGDAEVMLGDATELAARALEASCAAPVRLRIYPRMWHVFPMYTEACGQSDAGATPGAGLPHSWQALEDIRDWLRRGAHGPRRRNFAQTARARLPALCGALVLGTAAAFSWYVANEHERGGGAGAGGGAALTFEFRERD